jgi:O-antigen/teichoic acid export membrane protein
MNRALRVLKNSTALSLSVLLERGITLFLPLYVARVQGKQVWGYYSTALAFVTLSASFAYWGLDQLLPREVARDRTRTGDFLANAGVVGGIASVLTTAIVIVIVHLLHYPPHVQYLIYIGSILTLFPRTEATLCEAIINGLEKMEWIVAVRFPSTVLRVACSVYLLSKGFGLDVLFIALAAYYILVCGVYLLLFKRFVPAFRLHFNWSLVRNLALQAVPFVTIIAMGETFKQLDRVFLSKLWDTTSVGIYSVGIMLVQIMYMIAPAIMNALFPILSRAYVVSRHQFASLISRMWAYCCPSTCTSIRPVCWSRMIRITSPG